MRQLGIQYSRLDTVQTAVDTDHVVMIANHHSMVGNCPHACCQLIIIREDSPAVSVTTEVLRGEERRATDMSDGTGLLGLAVSKRVFSADRLTCVFHYKQMMLVCQRHDGFHVGALSEEVYRHNSFGLRRDSTAYGLDIHVHRVPIYVNDYRR